MKFMCCICTKIYWKTCCAVASIIIDGTNNGGRVCSNQTCLRCEIIFSMCTRFILNSFRSFVCLEKGSKSFLLKIKLILSCWRWVKIARNCYDAKKNWWSKRFQFSLTNLVSYANSEMHRATEPVHQMTGSDYSLSLSHSLSMPAE